MLSSKLECSPQAEHYLYYSLALTALYNSASKKDQSDYLEILENNQQKMKIWADSCAANFLHRYFLVEAEIARISGKFSEAIELYDDAIASAQQYEYIQNAALANELAAKFWLERGNQKIAQVYMREAHYGYQQWGAKRKLKDLEDKYSLLLSEVIQPQTRHQTTRISSVTTTSSSIDVLDLTTVLKASQALAAEIVLERLIDKLIKIAVENAGAQMGFLIMEKEGQLIIEAQGTVEQNKVAVRQSTLVSTSQQLPLSLINYVKRTREDVVLSDATCEGIFTTDSYIAQRQPKSILCTPIIHQSQLIGLLYLENNLSTGAFTPDRLEVLKILSAQAAISLQNAQLYVALRENEKRLTQFLEAMPIGVFALNAKGEPYYANQAAQQILGKGIVTVATTDQLTEIYQVYLAGTDQLYPIEQQPLIRALDGESTTIDNLEIHQPDRIVPLEVSATPVFDEKGQIAYAIAAFQDITQRKQAEVDRVQFTQELALKNLALEQAKDELEQYSQTLEQKVSERTKELSQTLEILKATQAELRFENDTNLNRE